MLFRSWYICESRTSGSSIKDNVVMASNATENTDVYFWFSAFMLQHLLSKDSYLIYIYLLTYSMVQSPSWEANCSAASQEIPRISRNPKVHYRTHKRPPPVSILGPNVNVS